jgi:hypothetical protein
MEKKNPYSSHQENANQNNEINTTYLLKWQKSKTLTPLDAGEDVSQQELSLIGRMQMTQPPFCTMTVWEFITELNIFSLKNVTIDFLDIYAKKSKTYVQGKTSI